MASKRRLSVTKRAILAGVLALFVALNAASPATAGGKSAQHFAGVPSVGALFVPGAFPAIHTCTASVVRTTSQNVIMTAAHCIYGSAAGYQFAPGYRNGKTPYGLWSVTGAYGAPGWISQQDPHRDYAFLTIAPMMFNGKQRTLQSVTGGNPLGRTARAGDSVTVIGYALGNNDEALRCTIPVYIHNTWPAFNCGGFPSGTSGSPWLRSTPRGKVIAGDIGGLHQGGCTPSTSYSPPLGKPAQTALARAVSHAKADVFPAAGSDGCN